MMKKLLGWMFVCLLTSVCSAEELNFLTVLSSPIGTFNMLEAADEEAPATSPLVHFCQERSPGGKIFLRGGDQPIQIGGYDSNSAIYGGIYMDPGSTLSGDAPEFLLDHFYLGDTGKASIGAIIADTMDINTGTPNYAQLKVNQTYHANNMNVTVASAAKMNINHGESKIERPTGGNGGGSVVIDGPSVPNMGLNSLMGVGGELVVSE
ncbi:MAG: hypothetical protein IKO35_02590, partial [Elusimicrobiaceae bacterium]|nr:hypothetical protein [Elusimicrobiaceae bacterium]